MNARTIVTTYLLATLYCIGVSILTGEAWLASGLMSCMAGLTLSMATIHGTDHQSPAMFRVGTMIKTMAVVWTFTQLVIFWGVFLWVLPTAILELEERYLVRPSEEADLLMRFGQDYDSYRKSVRLWIPRIVGRHLESHHN